MGEPARERLSSAQQDGMRKDSKDYWIARSPFQWRHAAAVARPVLDIVIRSPVRVSQWCWVEQQSRRAAVLLLLQGFLTDPRGADHFSSGWEQRGRFIYMAVSMVSRSFHGSRVACWRTEDGARN